MYIRISKLMSVKCLRKHFEGVSMTIPEVHVREARSRTKPGDLTSCFEAHKRLLSYLYLARNVRSSAQCPMKSLECYDQSLPRFLIWIKIGDQSTEATASVKFQVCN